MNTTPHTQDLLADWQRVVFLHFLVDPDRLRPYVPAPLELELYEGRGCFSLVALTMRRFRPCRWASPGWLLRPIARQSFLNFRTYVRRGDERGALFLHGWLSQPLPVPLPSGMFGLPYAFASVDYTDRPGTGAVGGVVRAQGRPEGFAFRAPIEACADFEPCAPGSLAEFAMERYTGFFSRRNQVYAFRAWHPPWLQSPLDLEIKDDSLLSATFPWFKEATLAAANFAPGFERVHLGRARRLEATSTAARSGHRLSAFYQMP